ncbi:barstar family protein [Streptomyces durbertensis]|uniref:Barstar family protein n=1 Tax=Streptomyces durbertensis TaxID=2448886 RepID=A0ABR6ELS7_9ACTN|nr:barstar family protein [Streptomyces durbertensis]MBB1246294.1 barstar family protein [Streptomyces durbertensis]
MTLPLPAMPDPSVAGLLDGSVPPGVYLWEPPPAGTRVTEVLDAARAVRWRTALTPLEGVTDKAAFLAACQSGMELPDWFGRNWDALADCLTDLSWWEEDNPEGYLFVLTGWADFAASAPEDATTATDVLTASAGFWSARDTPFVALLG